eukprot:GILI01016895.1.p1 GENE.GILI01016895.1~~GILI01016895.1.p1  ORF type:complete len:245 (+),score=46.10 GILI01016895.1:111-737(+)
MKGRRSVFLLFVCVCIAHFGAAQKLQGSLPDMVMMMETSIGPVEIKLFPDVAPLAVHNFVRLALNHYYDGHIFHRVIKNFIVQTGDPTGTGYGGQSIWGRPFATEIKEGVTFAKAGMVAMANAGPGTNKSQFFINLAPTKQLNYHYTIFGEVSAGFDYVARMQEEECDEDFRPLEPIRVIRIYPKTQNLNALLFKGPRPTLRKFVSPT